MGRTRWLIDEGPLRVLRCGLWRYNAILVADGGSACAVDPGIVPDELDMLRANVADHEVTHVVLTHAHHDHLRGWSAFPGARVVMPRVGAEKAPERQQRILAGKKAVDAKLGVEDPEFRYPRPDEVFDERNALRVGDLTLELRFLPGHSNCTSVVVIPELRTMLTADYLVVPGLPYCRWEARPFESAHRAMREWVEAEGIERVVPAHERILEGRDEILGALDAELDYFAFLREEVRRRVADGEGDDALVRGAARSMGERRGVDLGPRAKQDADNARRVLAEERGA